MVIASATPRRAASFAAVASAVITTTGIDEIAGSRRVLSHGLLRPNLGAKEMEEMERQVKDLKIDAWKMYTGAELGEIKSRPDGSVTFVFRATVKEGSK